MAEKNIKTNKSNIYSLSIKGEGLSRKQFIQSSLRYGILGGILVLTGFIIIKRKITIESSCDENFACKNCKKYSNCSLPEKG